MRDIQLEHSLKGIFPGKNVNKSALDREIEVLAQEFAWNEMKNSAPLPNSLMTESAYEMRLKEEFKEKLEMREIGEALSTALFMVNTEHAAQECEIIKSLIENEGVEDEWKETFSCLEQVVYEMSS